MLRFILSIAFVVIPLFAATATDGGIPASAPVISSEPATLVDAGAPSVVSAAPSVEPSALVPSVVEIAVDAKSVVEQGKEVIQGPTVVGVAGFLAALFLLITKLARRSGKLLKQVQVNKVVAICSALALGASSVTPGMPWWGAIIVGISPLLFTLGLGDKEA
jgi:hypothetical protein